MSKNKTCFFIAPIGDEGSPERKRSDLVLRHIVEPVVEKFGYKAVRGDKIDKPGLITSQVIQGVLDSDLVIADLTGKNPNVFYELALRHATKKPFIQLIEEGGKIPFDVAGLRTIHFDYQDLDSVVRCKSDLENQLCTVEANPKDVESPVAVAIDLERLRTRSLPVDQYILEAREFQSEIAQRIYNLELALGQLISAQPPRYEYRQLPDGTMGNVFVMPPAYLPNPPAINFVDRSSSPSSTPSPQISPEFARKAMAALRKAGTVESQPPTREKDTKNER